MDELRVCAHGELVSNALEQLISTAAKLLDFFILADTWILALCASVSSLSRPGVNPSAHPVGRLDQLRPRRRTPDIRFTYVHSAGAAPTDPPLQLIFKSYR